MQELRRARLASVILEEVSRLVSREIKDPRIPPVTFTQVEVVQDASQATIFVSLLGGRDETPEGDARMKECLAGLGSASHYLRKQLARLLNVRHIPTLIFKEDRGLANVSRVHELLKQIEPGSKSSGESES